MNVNMTVITMTDIIKLKDPRKIPNASSEMQPRKVFTVKHISVYFLDALDAQNFKVKKKHKNSSRRVMNV